MKSSTEGAPVLQGAAEAEMVSGIVGTSMGAFILKDALS